MSLLIERLHSFDKSLIEKIFKKSGSKLIDPNPDFFTDPNNVLMIAYEKGLPCGFLHAYILASPAKQRNKMFLYSIDTFVRYRKKGIASKLIESLKKLAKKENCEGIFLITQKNNKAAINLYESSGGMANSKEDQLFTFTLLEE